MNINDLRTAADLCKYYGVKSLLYGGPGTGKTPLISTAPNPVLCATEPGLLSLRGTNVPVYEAPTYDKVKDFVQWGISSHEARQFQTLAMDSVSQFAENELAYQMTQNKDGRKAYGKMSERCMEIFTWLYYAQAKHVILVAKQSTIELDGINRLMPYFPGKDLYVKVPHLYDLIMRVSYKQMQDGKQHRVFETQDAFNFVARDRIGKLAAIEPAHWGNVIAKCLT